MPYMLVHPLPPPRRNPYSPDLPTFTTSSHAIAHFFHSQGWRTCHVYADFSSSSSTCSPSTSPSLTSSRSSSRASSHSITSNGYIEASSLSSKQLGPEHEETACCLSNTGSSVRSCGPVVELHFYQITLNGALFHGPRAKAMQLRYLRWYAHPHISFDNEDGDVDLHLPNLSALALQKETDEDFWRRERGAERRRRRKEREAREKAWYEVHVNNRERGGKWEFEMGMAGNVIPGLCVKLVKREEGDKCEKMMRVEQDDEIDKELGEQWETYERAQLANEGLEWAEDGETLRKTSDV